MAVLRLARPLWQDLAPRAPRFAPLSGARTVDVAIIGGGVTGAAAAWTFATAGLSVAVLEARRVGSGSTLASTALLMQEPDEDFAALRGRYGAPATKRIWELIRRATRQFVAAIRRLKIDAGLRQRDSVYYTLRPDCVARLRLEHDSRRRAGLGGHWLDARALARATGIGAGHSGGGIRTRGNAEADPYRVCLGLVDAAVRAGASIFERSPVRRVDVERRGVVLHVASGNFGDSAGPCRLRASQVVIATGYATPDFKPLLGRFRMWNTYVATTEPLSAAMRRQIGLGPVMLWDTDRPYHYARWGPQGRLMVGGCDRPVIVGEPRVRALAERTAGLITHFSNLYPVLHDARFTHAWEGLFATAPDGLPYIGPHRRYPRHLFALGYGGNGMTFGFLAAELLLRRLEGRIDADQEFFAFSRLR
jgi:glycine/D-amino acid oxidase-like deaminating enzyme